MKTHEKKFFLTKAKTFFGIEYDPNDDTWTLEDQSVKFNFRFSILQVNPIHINMIKRMFVINLEKYALGYCTQHYSYFKLLLQNIYTTSNTIPKLITKMHIENFKAFLGQRDEYKLAAINKFIRDLRKIGSDLITENACTYLEEVTLAPNAQGERIMNHDPEKGPFTELEEKAILEAAKNHLVNKMITSEDYLLIRLFLAYGQRRGSYAALKVCDVKARLKNEITEISIDIPMLKKRGAKYREVMANRIVPKHIGTFLLIQVDSILKAFEGIIDDPLQAPLFPSHHFKSYEENNRMVYLHNMEEKAKPNAYHYNPKDLSYRTQKNIKVYENFFRKNGNAY
jgi:integrase